MSPVIRPFVLACLTGVFLPFPALAQFDYGQAGIVEGSVEVAWSTEVVRHEFEGAKRGRVLERSTTSETVSSPLLFAIVSSDPRARIEHLRQGLAKNPRSGFAAIFITGSSFSRTRNEDEQPFVSPSPPISPLTWKFSSTTEAVPLCEPYANKLEDASKQTGGGVVKQRIVNVSIQLDPKAAEYRVCGGITGLDRADLPSDLKRREIDFSASGECITKWVPLDSSLNGHSVNLPSPFGSCDAPAAAEDVDPESGARTRTEHVFPTIPIDHLNEYMAQPNVPRVFSTPFSSTFDETDTVTKTKGTVVVRFGRTDRSLELSAENDEDYRTWLPHAEEDPKKRPVRVRAKLVEKGAAKKDLLSFSLSSVTRLPGVATNWPAKDPGGEPDLYFPASAHNMKHFVITDESSVVTRERVSEAIVEVAARDYGAYGRVVAKALGGGTGVSTYDQAPYLAIPQDENGNKIADAWEREVGVFGTSPDPLADGDELPKDQRRNGDGLTLFEEYRGFWVSSTLAGRADRLAKTGGPGHVRTNPKHKDLFLRDETGMFQKHYAAHNPAELTWHLVDRQGILLFPISYESPNDIGDPKPSELPDNRWINFNTPKELRANQQRGLHLVYSSPKYLGLPDLFTAGAAMGGLSFNVRGTYYVVVHRESTFVPNVKKAVEESAEGAKRFNSQQALEIATTQYENTVIHELGHAVGIRHHCKGLRRYPPSPLPGQPAPEGPVYERLTCANEWDADPLHVHLAMGGVPSCAMTYTYQSEKEFRTARILNKQRTYCRKHHTYVDDYLNKQPADDCFGQIDVSTAP